MAVTKLNREHPGFDAGIDAVTIVNYIEGVTGGRSLDVAGFAPAVIRAGHVVIRATASGDYKPMPVDVAGDAYAALPGGHTIEGVTVSSVTTDNAMVSIMVRGTVNEIASPYPVTAAIKTALPLIRFVKD